jgi:hypothetical protein|tara:strand:- start:200 stop:1129 length:930 start_codon:yes stop_codon:yes gene_type:complete
MAKQDKNSREFDFEIEQKGKSVNRAFKLTEVSLNQQNEATKVYNRAFRDALESGALLRNKLEDHMRQQGIWDDEKQKQLDDVQRAILENEKKIAKGGIRLKVAKDLALQMSDKRVEMRNILMQRNSLDGNTAEGQADNARFDYLVSASLVYSDSGKPYFKDLADYRNRSTEPVAIEAARRLAQLVYGLDSNYEKNLPENKFLSDFEFVDNDLRLINNEGQYVDREGNLLNEDGRFVDDEGNLIDREGNPVTEDGEYKFDQAPFLDDDGNPIVKEEASAEEETEESEPEDEEEATEEAEAETESKEKTEA